MNSRASVSWKVASLVMAVCLAMGVMIGLVIPTMQTKRDSAETDLLRGTADRRLTEANGNMDHMDEVYVEEVYVEEPLPVSEHVDPSDLIWPGESDHFTRGTGLWGSDEESWDAVGVMGARQDMEKGMTGFMELGFSYEFLPSTSTYSYMMSPDDIFEEGDEWTTGRVNEVRSETGLDSYLSFPWPSTDTFSYQY